jgi:hypothetical protein
MPMSGPQRCISLKAASPYWPTWQGPHVHGKLQWRWQRTFSEINIQSPGEDVFRHSLNLKMNGHICRLRPVTIAYSESNCPFYCCSATRDRASKRPLTSSSLTKILYFFRCYTCAVRLNISLSFCLITLLISQKLLFVLHSVLFLNFQILCWAPCFKQFDRLKGSLSSNAGTAIVMWKIHWVIFLQFSVLTRKEAVMGIRNEICCWAAKSKSACTDSQLYL